MTIKVLVVDDEALARLRLRTLLGDCVAPAALVVAEAADAVQAMSALQRDSFDAVLLDIGMPGLDGMGLARVIATLPQPPAVVFVTAHSSPALDLRGGVAAAVAVVAVVEEGAEIMAMP